MFGFLLMNRQLILRTNHRHREVVNGQHLSRLRRNERVSLCLKSGLERIISSDVTFKRGRQRIRRPLVSSRDFPDDFRGA
jgi:hypothetical protein